MQPTAPASLLALPPPNPKQHCNAAVCAQKEHGSFKRIGTDLFFEKSVSLVDALCGAHFHLPHLDERVLEVASDGVIKPDSWMCIKVGAAAWRQRLPAPVPASASFPCLRLFLPAPVPASACSCQRLCFLLPAPRSPACACSLGDAAVRTSSPWHAVSCRVWVWVCGAA
jgi:hypothetical protein